MPKIEPLHGINIVLYTDNQDAIRTHDMLNSLNISHYWNDYGNGQSISHVCKERHEFLCWNAILRMMPVLQQQYFEKKCFILNFCLYR